MMIVMKIMAESSGPVGDGEYSLSPSIELSELVSSPRLGLRVVVLEVGNGPVRIVSLLDVALVSLVDVVMEGILEGNGVELVGALHFHSEGSNDGFVGSPGVGHQSRGVEESGPDNVGLEVLLDSAFLESPSHDFNVGVGVVDEFELVESVAAPVVSLGDGSAVEVEVGVVMVAEVIGGVDEASHKQKLFGEMVTYLIIVVRVLLLGWRVRAEEGWGGETWWDFVVVLLGKRMECSGLGIQESFSVVLEGNRERQNESQSQFRKGE